MVVKGKGKYPQPKQAEVPSPTPNIIKIASLNKLPASDKALELLHEVAALVSPVMHHYHFKVNVLCEMYPKKQGLLGLNINRGQKICLRLRSPTDSKWFLDRNEIVGTMLHELTHNWHGAHDARFYKVLDELKDKYYELQISESLKNSSYPNNFSPTLRTFSKKPNPAKKYTTRVTKLGTKMENSSLSANASLRSLMLLAAERRLRDSKICVEDDKEKIADAPKDSELRIIEIISLDSDEEPDIKGPGSDSTITDASKKPPENGQELHDVVFID